MGRKTFGTVDGPDGWSAERGYGADQDGRTAFFVVTSTQPAHVRLAEFGAVHGRHGLLSG